MKFSNQNYQKSRCSRSPAYEALLNKYNPLTNYTKTSTQMFNKKLNQKNGRKTNPLGTMLQKQSNEIVFYKNTQNKNQKKKKINKQNQQEHTEALLIEKETLNQKKIYLQNEYENERMRECTFSPCVVGDNSHRSVNQVLEDMKKAEQRQNQKLLQLKNEQEEKTKETVSFQPNKSCTSCWFSNNTSNLHLSPSLGQSVTLLKSPNQSKLSKLSNISCHDRLYNNAKEKWIKNVMPGKENQPPVNEIQLEVSTHRSRVAGFFSPQTKIEPKKSPHSKSPYISQIFEKSYQETRKGNISEYLYAEGLERMQKKGKNANMKNDDMISNHSNQYMNKAQDLNLTKLIIKEIVNNSYEVFDSENENNIAQLPNEKLMNKTMNYNQVWQILIRIGFFHQVNLNNTSFMQTTEEINFNNIELSSQQQSQLENQYSELNRMLEYLNLDINQSINVKILCTFILTVLGVQMTNQILSLINEELGQDNLFDDIEHQQLQLIKSSSEQIRKQFNSFTKTRMATAGLRRKQLNQISSQQNFMSARSRQLSNQRRTKLIQLSPQTELSSHCSQNTIQTYADVLFLEKQMVDQKVLQMKKEQQQKEVEKCTFKPKINEDKWKNNYTIENQENWQNENIENSYMSKNSYCKKVGKIPSSPIQRSHELYEISQRFQQRVDRPVVEIEFEKQQNECTFNPNLIAEQKKNRLNQVPLREFERNAIEKNISRIERGREINEYLLRSYERSPEIIAKSQYLIKNKFYLDPQIQKLQNAEKQFNKNSSNQSMNESQSLPQPISIAEIHLSPSYSEKIYIYPGDSSDKLAQEFAIRHQLDQKMTMKLQEMLENKILSAL